MKPCTKRKLFSRRFSAKSARGHSCENAALTLDFLNHPSVFETLRVYDGRIFQEEQHRVRLSESCAALGRELPLGRKALKLWFRASIRKSGISNALLRLSVHWRRNDEGELVLSVREFQSHPSAWYEKGVTLRTAVGRRPTLKAQDPQIKASQYVCGVLAMLDHVGATGCVDPAPAHELLFLGSLGTLAEGTVSNIFIVNPVPAWRCGRSGRRGNEAEEKSLLTPSVGSGILKGVTREFVMDLARKRGYAVEECLLTRHEVYKAEECFITNTSSEVLPVVCVDERVIANGCPGLVTQRLAEDFKKNR